MTIENRIQLRHGSTMPKNGDLLPWELGVSNGRLFIGSERQDSQGQWIVEKITNYVTPEMFGAIGDGITDDSAAIQKAIDSNCPVSFENKTYLCKSIITKYSDNVILIGKGQTVLKWNITTTEGLHTGQGMFSDDGYDSTTPYKRIGNVYLEGIIFDGNGENIQDFPVTDILGLCIFYGRNNIVVKNTVFKNCHCDGLFAGGIGHSVEITNSVFKKLGLYSPTGSSSRNAMSLSRTMWDRKEEAIVGVTTPLHATISNCFFSDIADEVCRIDGFNIVALKDSSFENIGMHVLEIGHMTGQGEFSHEIMNCVGKNIARSVYNSGADGGGDFPYKGTIKVENCIFTEMQWTGSTARVARTATSTLIEGYTQGFKPDVFVTNCIFESTNLAYQEGDDNHYIETSEVNHLISGENVVIRNTQIKYGIIRVRIPIVCYNSVIIEDSYLWLQRALGGNYITTLQDQGKVVLFRSRFDTQDIASLISTSSQKDLVINVEKCIIGRPESSSGYAASTIWYIVHIVEGGISERIEIRLVDNIINSDFQGRPIHNDSTEDFIAKVIYCTGNYIRPDTIEWGTFCNLNAAFKLIKDNSAYNGT